MNLFTAGGKHDQLPKPVAQTDAQSTQAGVIQTSWQPYTTMGGMEASPAITQTYRSSGWYSLPESYHFRLQMEESAGLNTSPRK